MAEEKDPKNRNWGGGRKKGSYDPAAYETQNSSIHLSSYDIEQLKLIGKTLNVNKSEAVRTAIRVYAALLKK